MHIRLFSLFIAFFGLLVVNALPLGSTDIKQQLSRRGNSTVQVRDSIDPIGVLERRTFKLPPGKTSAKCKKGGAKRELNHLYRRTSDSSSQAYWKAVGDMGAAWDAAGIQYVLIGGTACAAFGNPRVTKDIDLIVADSDKAMAALKTKLGARVAEGCTADFIPFATIDGIDLDVFDAGLWQGNRPQYMTHLSSPQTVKAPKTGQNVHALQLAKLIAEKEQSAKDRQGTPKGVSDAADVKFLQSLHK